MAASATSSSAPAPSASGGKPSAPPPPPGALRRLWIWFALGPIVWALHEAVSYIGSYNACRAGGGPRAISLPASAVALVLMALVTVALARGRRRFPHADIVGTGVRNERAAFLALFGGVLAAIALIGIVLATGAAFVEGCR